jgi:hypothetical protein
METQEKGIGMVEDEITGQASQECCTYAWGRVQVWTMTHNIPAKRMQSEISKLSGTCMATFLNSLDYYVACSIADGAAKIIVVEYGVE